MKIRNFLQSIDRQAIIAYTDQYGVITYVNDNFCHISGYAKEDLIGRDHRIVNSGIHDKEFFTEMWKTILGGGVWVGEVCNKKKNGDYYWVNTTISPELSEEGDILGFFAIRYDITKQKELELQNAELVRVNESVQEIANIGGWEFCINTNQFLWSKQIYLIHEVPIDFKIHKNLAVEFYIKEDRERILNHLNECRSHGVKFDEQFQIVTAKGKKLWIRVTGEPVYSTAGNVLKLRGTFQDIDEMKRNEIKAEEERKKFLHGAKLSTLGEMSSSLIHEMTNPISVISGILGSAKKLKDIEDVHEVLAKMDIPLDRLHKMVRNMRRFSRNETAIREVRVNDLSEIIHSSVEYTRHKYRSLMVSCNINIDKSLPLLCDASELEQVFVNLLNNAADAVAEEKERWVEISYEQDPRKGLFVYITDSGHGIPSETVKNMFNSFFTTKDKDKGTGLGLSIVKDLIKQHGGTISVDQNCPNTRFVIFFSQDVLRAV